MTVTPFEHTAIGAFAGSCEVLIMQPTVALKNALQEGRPLPRNPLHYYRGLTLNVLSMAPITASQFGTSRFVQQLMLGKADGELTDTQRFISAATAGAASAFIASPTELLIIQQQRTGRALAAECKHFFSNYKSPSLYRGVTCTIAREGFYSAGYLGLFPVMQRTLTEQGYSPGASLVAAALVGGSFGAITSHPFDTAKTRMQAFMYSKPEYLTMAATFRSLYEAGGFRQFYRGLLPRMTRIIGATLILNTIRSNTVNYLEDARSPKA